MGNPAKARRAAWLAALSLWACAPKTAEQHLAEARQALDSRDLTAASVHLRAALEQDPRAAETRLLLGRTLLDLGDLPGAETQLSKAAELGVPALSLALPEARLWLAQDKPKRVLERHRNKRLDKPAEDAELRLQGALAHAALNQAEAAEAELDQALAQQPDYADALLLRARLRLIAGQAQPALALLKELVARPKASDEAWVLHAMALSDTGAPAPDLLDSLRKALALNPRNASAHAGVVQLMLRENRLDEAKTQLEAFQKARPGDLTGKALTVQLALARKDLVKARDAAQDLLKLAGDSATALLLAGQVAYQMGDWLGTETHLGKALAQNPELGRARALLARSYMKQGETDKALATLKPRLSGAKVDANLLTLAGEIHLLRGETTKAEAALAAATAQAPEDLQSRLSLALLRIGSGQQERGFSELQALAAEDKGRAAALALINSRLQARQFDKALEAIAALEAKEPASPLAAQLRGQLELSRGDLAAARLAFDEALKRDADDFQSIASLAALDMAEQAGADKAIARFEALLKRKPKHLKARLAVLRLHSGKGLQGAAMTKMLADAVKEIPDAAEPRLLLIRHLLDGKEPKAALAAAQEAAVALPNQAEVLDALGRAQMANNELLQAAATFGKWAALNPQSVAAQMRLAEVQVARKDPDGAAEHLKKALTLQPQHLDAQRAMVSLLLTKAQHEAALGLARQMQARRDQRMIGLLIEGDIEAHRRAWPAARKAYAAALELEPKAGHLAVKLHQAHLGGGDKAGAARFAEQWSRQQPRNLEFQLHLGNLAAAAGQHAQAEAYYAKAHAIEPDNPAVANNLAWLRAKLRRPDALALAQQLNARFPGNPVFLNTLALALAESGDLEGALRTQRESLAHAKLPAARLQLAELLLRAERKDEARRELQQLAALDGRHPEKAQAQRLLSSLK